jgi:hypothetical protein
LKLNDERPLALVTARALTSDAETKNVELSMSKDVEIPVHGKACVGHRVVAAVVA